MNGKIIFHYRNIEKLADFIGTSDKGGNFAIDQVISSRIVLGVLL
jgi:hypothetical protein